MENILSMPMTHTGETCCSSQRLLSEVAALFCLMLGLALSAKEVNWRTSFFIEAKMAEDVAYAELSFHSSFKEQENISKCHTVEPKDIPVSSSRWRCSALVLLTLCLLLTTSLLVLGLLFLQVSTDLEKENGDLKLMMEDFRRNSSMRISKLKTDLCLKGEDEEMQTDPKCIICPLNWHLIGATCYYVSRGTKTWHESKQFCASWSSTLLIINEENKAFVQKTREKIISTNSWIGIYKDESGQLTWTNGKRIEQIPRWLHPYNIRGKEECAYLYRFIDVYTDELCSSKRQWTCEKAGIELT